MNEELRLEPVADPRIEDIRWLEKGVMDYTAEQIELGDRVPLGFYFRDAQDQIVAGITGRIAVRWLLIHVLWVHPDLRGQGLGKKLMQAMEQAALERDCLGAQVDTLSVQAPDFYTRLGYKIIGTVDNCPPGHQRHFLAKSFG